MVQRKEQPSKSQQFQTACSGFALCCVILFLVNNTTAVHKAWGEDLFALVNKIILGIGFSTFLASGLVGVNSLLQKRGMMKGPAKRIFDAIFEEDKSDDK